MNIFYSRGKRSAFIIALVLGGIPALALGQESVRVTALVFETEPWEVSVVGGVPDGKGGIQGRQVGGIVTSQFPTAVVRLNLGSPADFNGEAIPAKIKRNFVFRCGSELSEGLPAVLIGKDIFSVKDGMFAKIGHSLLTTGNPPKPESDPVLFDLKLVSRQEGTLVFEVCCTLARAGSSNQSEPPTVLLEEIIGLRPGAPILIGFPYLQKTKGRFVYWIALLLE
jgi:hypothetical protein